MTLSPWAEWKGRVRKGSVSLCSVKLSSISLCSVALCSVFICSVSLYLLALFVPLCLFRCLLTTRAASMLGPTALIQLIPHPLPTATQALQCIILILQCTPPITHHVNYPLSIAITYHPLQTRIHALQYNALSYYNAMLPLLADPVQCDKCTGASQLSQLHIIQILTKLQDPRFDIWLHCMYHKINLKIFSFDKGFRAASSLS